MTKHPICGMEVHEETALNGERGGSHVLFFQQGLRDGIPVSLNGLADKVAGIFVPVVLAVCLPPRARSFQEPRGAPVGRAADSACGPLDTCAGRL